ncbi:MAG: hypothetical protein VB131_10155 [Burkholderia gladioli]
MNAPDPTRLVMVAHVTVDDETLIVDVKEIHVALAHLSGSLLPGMRIEPTIRIDTMTEPEFAALPEYQ